MKIKTMIGIFIVLFIIGSLVVSASDWWRPTPAAALTTINSQGGQPTCSAAYRGTLWITYGGLGVADVVSVCSKTAIDVYVWKVVTLA